jgi:hypothetical protein
LTASATVKPYGPIARLTRSLAWPVAAVVAVIALRKQLAHLMAQRPLQRVKAGPFEVEWDKLAAEAEKEIEGAAGMPRDDVQPKSS